MLKLTEKYRLDLDTQANVLLASPCGTKLMVGNQSPESDYNDGHVSVDIWDLESKQKIAMLADKTVERSSMVQDIATLVIDTPSNLLISGHRTMGGITICNLTDRENPHNLLRSSSGVFMRGIKVVGNELLAIDAQNNQYVFDLHTLEMLNKHSDAPF